LGKGIKGRGNLLKYPLLPFPLPANKAPSPFSLRLWGEDKEKAPGEEI